MAVAPYDGRVYGYGSRGEFVKTIQTVLQGAGLYSGAIDGIWGPKTDAGVRQWMFKLGLIGSATGGGAIYWGPKTQAATDQFFQWLSGQTGGGGGGAPVPAPAPAPNTSPPPPPPVPDIPNTPPPAPPPPNDPTPNTPPPGPAVDQDALAYLEDILDRYNLGGLGQWAYDQMVAGKSQVEILQALRERQEFKDRFKAIFMREQAGLNPISPEDVLAYEAQASQLMKAAGFATGFWDDPDDFANLIGKNVSVVELAERINNGYLRVTQAPQEVRSVFAEWFGPSGDAALAMMFLDPGKALPTLQREVLKAEAAGAAMRFGFDINENQADRIASLGYDYSQSTTGFQNLDALRPLFAETITEQQDLDANVEGVEAVFGFGPDAQGVLERRQDERLAAFKGNGGAMIGSKGATGLGTAE